MRLLIPKYFEVNEESLKQRVYEAFTEKFGDGFVKKIFIGKYPSSYGVIVSITSKENLSEILKLSHSLSDEFEDQGLPVTISTREV